MPSVRASERVYSNGTLPAFLPFSPIPQQRHPVTQHVLQLRDALPCERCGLETGLHYCLHCYLLLCLRCDICVGGSVTYCPTCLRYAAREGVPFYRIRLCYREVYASLRSALARTHAGETG